MTYVWFFLGALWYTLGAILICGTAVSLCRFLFIRMMGRGFGRGVVMATSALGTPIHELGHAMHTYYYLLTTKICCDSIASAAHPS